MEISDRIRMTQQRCEESSRQNWGYFGMKSISRGLIFIIAKGHLCCEKDTGFWLLFDFVIIELAFALLEKLTFHMIPESREIRKEWVLF